MRGIVSSTWVASTCRSGSLIVIIKPSRKATTSIRATFLLLVNRAPIRSPIGPIAISAPLENSIMPTMTNTPPSKNANNTLVGTGATVRESTRTIAIIGKTAWSPSRNFSCNVVLSIEKLPVTHNRNNQSPLL